MTRFGKTAQTPACHLVLDSRRFAGEFFARHTPIESHDKIPRFRPIVVPRDLFLQG
jgi:hypothetical protein